MRDRAIARHGYPVRRATAAPVGVVTSGTQTPFLKKAIGFAMVPVDMTRASARRSRSTFAAARARAEVVPEPFYKRPGEGRDEPRSELHVSEQI